MTAIMITFDGRELPARAGQTVAAALLENGVRAWRRTRHGDRPRGAFCGIGICFDCLLVVDDKPGQRACLVTVRDGMSLAAEVERRPGS